MEKTSWRMVRSAPWFGVPHSKGDLTGYSPDLPGRTGSSVASRKGGLLAPEPFRLPASVRSPCSTARAHSRV